MVPLDVDVITSVRTILDTAPFTAGAGQSTGETAIDPISQMTVEKAPVSATWSHAGALAAELARRHRYPTNPKLPEP